MEFLTRSQLGTRWQISQRSLDRWRQIGRLPWVDLSRGKGHRPVVRFALPDVQNFEKDARLDVKEEAGHGNYHAFATPWKTSAAVPSPSAQSRKGGERMKTVQNPRSQHGGKI